MAKVREFIEKLGYEDVHVRDGGVLDFGRQDVVMISVRRTPPATMGERQNG